MTTTPITPTLPDLKTALTSLMELWPNSTRIDTLSSKLADRPAQNTLILLGAAALVFYHAERHTNPKVNTIYDALEYCSSSLSVGYTNIFPQTPLGKLIATLLMTYGPALTGAMLNGPKHPASPPAETPATQQKILTTLEQILAKLPNAGDHSA